MSFHRISSDEQRRKAWLERIRQMNMPSLQYSYICSDYFSASCFQSNLQLNISGQRCKRRPKEDAVPPIFDYALQSITNRPRLSSENRRDRRMHQEDSYISFLIIAFYERISSSRYVTISDSLRIRNDRNLIH